MNQKGSSITGIIIGLLILSAVVFGAFYFLGDRQPETSNQEDAAMTDETAGWESYEGAGFKFRYPPPYSLENGEHHLYYHEVINEKINGYRIVNRDVSKPSESCFNAKEAQSYICHPYIGFFTVGETEFDIPDYLPSGEIALAGITFSYTDRSVEDEGWFEYLVPLPNGETLVIIKNFSGKKEHLDLYDLAQNMQSFELEAGEEAIIFYNVLKTIEFIQ